MELTIGEIITSYEFWVSCIVVFVLNLAISFGKRR
jgi:hypothetical protein